MAKFGQVFISGAVWIVIAAGIGILGSWLTSLSGIWRYLGWLLAVGGYGFAGLSALHLWQMTTFQVRGMRMMREDPERFAQAKRRYEEAMDRKHDEEG